MDAIYTPQAADEPAYLILVTAAASKQAVPAHVVEAVQHALRSVRGSERSTSGYVDRFVVDWLLPPCAHMCEER